MSLSLNNFNALFWGLVVSIGLFGYSVLQGWIYFHENADKWPLKLFVAIILLLNIATTCLDAQVIHASLSSNYVNEPATLRALSPSITAEFAMTIVIIFLVEMFFAIQAYRLAKSCIIIPGFIVFCAAGSLVTGIMFVNDLRHDLLIDMGATRIKLNSAFCLSFAAISDIIAMSFLAAVLSLQRMRTESTMLKTTIRRLIMYTIIRGLLLAIAQIVCLLIFFAMPQNIDWMPVYLCLSKLYAITLVAVLNARTHLRTAGYTVQKAAPAVMCDSPPAPMAQNRAHWKLWIVRMVQKILHIVNIHHQIECPSDHSDGRIAHLKEPTMADSIALEPRHSCLESDATYANAHTTIC